MQEYNLQSEFEEKKLQISPDTTWLVIDVQCNGSLDELSKLCKLFREYKNVPIVVMTDSSTHIHLVSYVPIGLTFTSDQWLQSVTVDKTVINGQSSLSFDQPIKEKDNIRKKLVSFLFDNKYISNDKSDSEDEMIMGDDFFDNLN